MAQDIWEIWEGVLISGNYPPNSRPQVLHNYITENEADYGGGIDLGGSSAIIKQNIISNNTAHIAGAAICAIGYSISNESPLITNNVIYANTAPDYNPDEWVSGGIIFITQSGIDPVDTPTYYPIIANNTITLNVEWYVGRGPAVVINNPFPNWVDAKLVNNIIVNNSKGICYYSSNQPSGEPSPESIAYNDVYNNTGGNYVGLSDRTGIQGNISVEPKFRNGLYLRDHISPCIDAGIPDPDGNLNNNEGQLWDWSLEPDFSAGHINMGAFGNTSIAELSCHVPYFQDDSSWGYPINSYYWEWPVDQPVNLTVHAVDCDGDTLNINFGFLPPGLSATVTPGNPAYLVITGTPNVTGTYSTTFIVQDNSQYLFSKTVPVTFNIFKYEPASPSCPYLYLWNGSDYVFENDLFPSGNPKEYTDYYLLMKELIPKDEVYSLKIKEELEETSHIDKVSLLQIDHPEGVKIAPTLEGKLYTYKEPLTAAANVVNSQGEDITELISTGADNKEYFGRQGEEIMLRFAKNGLRDETRLILSSDLPRPKPNYAKSIHLQFKDKKGQWQNLVVLHPHEYWDIWAVDLSPYLEDLGKDEDLEIKIFFTQDHKLDFVALDTSQQAPIVVTELPLLKATHSKDNDIRLKLETSDNDYTRTIKGDYIDLEFPYLSKPTQKEALSLSVRVGIGKTRNRFRYF